MCVKYILLSNQILSASQDKIKNILEKSIGKTGNGKEDLLYAYEDEDVDGVKDE